MPYATAGGVSRADMSGDPAWIEIDEGQYAQALAGMAAGKQVSIDGGFAVVDPPEPEDPPVPDADDLASSARARRDALLTASDWVTLRSIETGGDVPPKWLTYRQALRDVPEQAGFPQTINWPAAPEI